MTQGTDPRALLVRLLEHLTPSEIETFLGRVVDPARLLLEPQTLRAELEGFLRAKQSAPLSGPATAALVRDLAPVVSALSASSAAHAAPPPGVAYAKLVTDARGVVGAGATLALLAPVRAISILTLMPSGIGPLIEGTSFEGHTANVVRLVVAYAEGLYKPMLRAALTLTWAARNETHSSPPTTLGAAMGHCRDAWDAGLCDALLDDRVRIVRNSEGHLGNRYDAVSQCVTFVNEKPNGQVERLTMTGPEFGAFTSDFMGRCTAMFAAAATT